MTGFAAFFRKELTEIVRTWRIWTLPGIVLFLAVFSPVITLLTSALLSAVAAGQPGVVMQMPAPTGAEACRQYLKSLDQIVLVVMIIIAAGSIPHERRSGVAALVLAKPLSRGSYVVAKLLSQLGLVIAAVLAGAGICALLTAIWLPHLPAGALFAAVGLWLVLATLFLSLTTLLSVLFKSTGAAWGTGLAAYLLLFSLGVWGAAARLSPVGLPNAAWVMLAGGHADFVVPVATALLASAVFALLAIAVFQRKDL